MNSKISIDSVADTRLNSALLLAKDLVKTVYQVYVFIQITGDAYWTEVSREIGLTLEYIVRKYYRPDPPAKSSKGKERQT